MIIGKSRTNQPVEGSEELEQTLEGKENKWELPEFIDVGDFNSLPEGIKVGDVIVDDDYPFIGFVVSINYTNKTLLVRGFTDELRPVDYSLDNNEWTSEFLQVGTPLFKHSIYSVDEDDTYHTYIKFISNISTPITSVQDFLVLWDNGSVGSLIAKETADVYMTHFDIVIGVGVNSSTNLSLGFISGDNGVLDDYSITDTVTTL